MPCWAFWRNVWPNACASAKAYAPDYPELKSFIREYTQDLVNTTAWRANLADAEQELLNDWTDRYGQNGQLMLYRPGLRHLPGHGLQKAVWACTNC